MYMIIILQMERMRLPEKQVRLSVMNISRVKATLSEECFVRLMPSVM